LDLWHQRRASEQIELIQGLKGRPVVRTALSRKVFIASKAGLSVFSQIADKRRIAYGAGVITLNTHSVKLGAMRSSKRSR